MDLVSNKNHNVCTYPAYVYFGYASLYLRQRDLDSFKTHRIGRYPDYGKFRYALSYIHGIVSGRSQEVRF